MPETIILDPTEVSTARTPLDITPWLDQGGIDWGNAAIQAYMAEAERGESPVDYRTPNRSIQGGFTFAYTQGGTTPMQARAKIQNKIALMQREGGWIKRITNSGSVVYADVVDAGITATSVSGVDSRAERDVNADFSLECRPDFYGDEIQLSDHAETSAGELVFTETGILGDYPARVRVVVDNDESSADQLGLLWSFRSRYYDSASTAAVKYEAESLQALDTARILALSGASGGTAVTHGTISTAWTPIVGTNIGGTSYLTHKGTYRMYARVYSTSGTLVQTRAVWDVGDLVNPAENSSSRLPGASNFYIVDYGELRLDQAPVGTHRWQGQIQARGDVGTENFSVDRIWLVNQDEGAGLLGGNFPLTNGLATYAARSEFNTESGAITGDALQTGGTWSWFGSGDTDDFNVSSGVATRTAVSDSAGLSSGRLILASTPTLTAQAVRADVKVSAGGNGGPRTGLLLRTNSPSFVYFGISWRTSGAMLLEYEGGVSRSVVIPRLSNDTWYTLHGIVPGNGQYILSLLAQGATQPIAQMIGSDSLLTGSGKVGLLDSHTDATASTRSYDNFAAWVPTIDPVVFSSRAAQLTTDGMYRQDTGGTAYGPVSTVRGDLPRLPPASLEARTCEVFLKGSRGDFASIPDSATGDDISARVNYRPSYLFVP